MPCILDIALSGLSALSVRMVLKAWTPPAPSREAVKLINDTCRRAQGRRKGKGERERAYALEKRKRDSHCLWGKQGTISHVF